jgi:hypothetical protein
MLCNQSIMFGLQLFESVEVRDVGNKRKSLSINHCMLNI